MATILSMARWHCNRFASLQRRHRFLLVIVLALSLESINHWRSNHVPRPQIALDPPFERGCRAPDPGPPTRENATVLMLARNDEVEGAVSSIRSLETQFNRFYHYPVVFLNNLPWSDEFKKRLTAEVSGEVVFDTINSSDWGFPEGTQLAQARTAMQKQQRNGVKYGGLENYHHMCRFNSGRFYDHSALQNYRWYWRVEPNVEFTCSITYDPFKEMIKHKKIYGYVMALWELGDTCPSLYRHVSDYRAARLNDMPFHQDSSMWLSMRTSSWLPWPFRLTMRFLPLHDASGDKWNLCHFWTNFEIADMEFFRSRQYRDFFQHLDSSGNFYNERWGDAPVHSLAVAMMLKPAEIHHFSDVGYVHDNFQHCPKNLRHAQLPESSPVNLRKTPPLTREFDTEVDDGIGCRCRCNPNKLQVRNICLNRLRTAVEPRPL